ncbi:hypothetical protein [Listeria booriae]
MTADRAGVLGKYEFKDILMHSINF